MSSNHIHPRYKQMFELMRDNPEPATGKQLWVINDLSIKLKKEFTLPLLKHEAFSIVTQLKIEQSDEQFEGED